MKFKLVALVLVVTVSGCTTFTQNESSSDRMPAESGQTSEPTNLSDSSAVVYYTSSGFQPSTITVEQGETVRWINNASNGMWVGSDQHPQHTGYSGSSLREHCQDGDQNTAAFDQCSTGEQFSFTFEKTGEWGYHNHVRYSDSGTVVVE